MFEFTGKTVACGNRDEKISFRLNLIRNETTTVLYGQMEDDFFGKTSVAGCSILSPEDTYNPVTGLKIAFKNLLSAQFYGAEFKQLYSQFRHFLYTSPDILIS